MNTLGLGNIHFLFFYPFQVVMDYIIRVLEYYHSTTIVLLVLFLYLVRYIHIVCVGGYDTYNNICP